MRQINDQREEILRAFLAKYRLQPEEVEQVIEYLPNQIVWSVRRKSQ